MLSRAFAGYIKVMHFIRSLNWEQRRPWVSPRPAMQSPVAIGHRNRRWRKNQAACKRRLLFVATTKTSPALAVTGAPSDRSYFGVIHVRVLTFGESHRRTGHLARESFDGHRCAIGVISPGYGGSRGDPRLVHSSLGFCWRMHNWLIDSDTQNQVSASRWFLGAGHRQR